MFALQVRPVARSSQHDVKELAASVNKRSTKISPLLDPNYNQALAFNYAGTPPP